MTAETKNCVDVILTLVGMVGATIAFIYTLTTWRAGQRWKRAEQLDKFIERFETDELSKLACTAIDWIFRTTTFRGKEFKIRDEDVLLALRIHKGRIPEFSSEQAAIRDALDTFLSFLGRLEVALQSGLIDVEPARKYFAYWIERLVTMDRHTDDGNILKGCTPAQMVTKYVEAYSDLESLRRLCRLLSVPPPATQEDQSAAKRGDS